MTTLNAALVDDRLPGIVGFLTPLLVMFLFAVTATPPEPVGSSEAPTYASTPRSSAALTSARRGWERLAAVAGANGDPHGSPS